MRSGVVWRRDVPLITDVAIALVLVGTVTFFVVVMEYCVGRGELTAAELGLMNATVRTAIAPAINNKNGTTKDIKEDSAWPTSAPQPAIP